MNFFCKGLHSEYFRLCELYVLCSNHSVKTAIDSNPRRDLKTGNGEKVERLLDREPRLLGSGLTSPTNVRILIKSLNFSGSNCLQNKRVGLDFGDFFLL